MKVENFRTFFIHNTTEELNSQYTNIKQQLNKVVRHRKINKI